jgi:hypothetical protein
MLLFTISGDFLRRMNGVTVVIKPVLGLETSVPSDIICGDGGIYCVMKERGLTGSRLILRKLYLSYELKEDYAVVQSGVLHNDETCAGIVIKHNRDMKEGIRVFTDGGIK